MRDKGEEIIAERRGVQERSKTLIRSIWEVGKGMKMVKLVKEGDWEDRDTDIEVQKKKVWEALKNWIKTRDDDDREVVKKERRLKDIRKGKSGEEKVRKEEKLVKKVLKNMS